MAGNDDDMVPLSAVRWRDEKIKILLDEIKDLEKTLFHANGRARAYRDVLVIKLGDGAPCIHKNDESDKTD